MALEGSITEAERNFVETWENVSEQQSYVIREDRRGDEQQVLVRGQQRFKITTYERILTQDKIRDSRNDPFLNGCFRPIIVPDSVSVKTNPNALSDDDILRIFKASDTAWDEYMAVIDSSATLRRMLDLADDSDLTVRRYREIETKVEETSNVGKRALAQKDQEKYDAMGPIGNPVAAAEPPKPVRRRS